MFLGDCLKATGRPRKAIENYCALASSQPKYADLAAVRAAPLLLEDRRYEEAFTLLARV